VSNRFLGWPPAVLATLITVALVVTELTDAGQRRWWAARPLTTSTVAGLLVLLITVLVVNQAAQQAAETAARACGPRRDQRHRPDRRRIGPGRITVATDSRQRVA
jgi:hypothetical protein